MSETVRVLLLDGDSLLRPALADQLRRLGFAVEEAATVGAAREAASRADVLLVGTGPTGASEQEARPGWPVPVLALVDATAGEEAGAMRPAGAEILPRPFRLGDLSARLTALAQGGPPREWRIGAWRLHPSSRTAEDAEGQRVRLTETEVSLLAYFCRAGGRVVPRGELLARVLGYAGDTQTHTLETHVYRLRRKLRAAPGQPPLLVKESEGYRLAWEASSES